MKKKLIISFIAVVLVVSLLTVCFAACNKKQDNNAPQPEPAHELTDDERYEATLGDFNAALQLAKTKNDVDERYAYMALAEAKLLESGVFIPTTSEGGRYGISKVVPYSVSPTLWGLDSSRLYTTLVATSYISVADRDALKELWADVKGTGTYIASAKAYLAAHGYSLKDEYNIGYSADPTTWDITDTYRAADSEVIVNTFDGLLAYDVEGYPQPALATSWSVSDDGLKYTFNIRQGVNWVTRDGTVYEEIEAQNWVDGMRHILDNGATDYLVTPLIKGAADYAAGEDDDFSHVGVRAVSKYVLEYELIEPTNYFITMFNYNPFAPICENFVEDCGDDYGSDPDNILYCGPYLISNYTKNNKIVFSANPHYWNASALNVHTINWKSYKDNDDVTATYVDMKAGILDGAGLNTSTVPMAKQDNLFDTYAFISGTNATTFGFFMNINRGSWATDGYEDTTSSQTDAQKAVTKAAMNNANFRMAFARGLDRAAYNALSVGDDCKLYSLQNSYTPGDFVQLEKAVTLSINGQNRTFPIGTYYGEIVQAQLDADMGEKAMKVWDPTQKNGQGSSAGFDGWFDEDLAIEYFNAAVAELAAQGVNVSADNPIHLDYPIYGAYQTYANRAQALKLRIAEVFDGKVVLDIVSTSLYGWYFVGYYAESGKECNYDLYDCSGWGPDYGDPATYLNTMMPETGDMIHCIGIY